MVRAFGHQNSVQKSRSFNFKKMFEIPGRQVQSMIIENGQDGSEAAEEKVLSRSHETRFVGSPLERHHIGSSVDRSMGPISRLDRSGAGAGSPQAARPNSDMDMMKDRFSKLLLGEDMSGGGKGVSSALALSNAITNLAASVFGEKSKLEPMSPERKSRWRKEIEWLLSVTDHIVEFVPSQQKSMDGTNMEIMVTKQRSDLLVNIPALRKLDAMLIGYLENFGNQNEFWYVSKDTNESEKGNAGRNDDKWWLPTVKVPSNGLSNVFKKWLLFQKESVNQVLKAAMAINAQVLSEMEIPESYIESLPKNGRASLGDSIYKSITIEYFDPGQFLSTMDLTTEHKVLDLKNRIEASIVIWKRKMHSKDGKSSWSSGVSLEKRELFEERAETILLLLKQRFPGLPQSVLDISKIQYNMDVGQAVLESYSRIIESLAFNVMSRIEDVLYADSRTQKLQEVEPNRNSVVDSSPLTREEIDKWCSSEAPNSRTLSDFMGWNLDKGATEMKKNYPTGNVDSYFKEENVRFKSKLGNVVTAKKMSYLEKLENLSGLRSPTARH